MQIKEITNKSQWEEFVQSNKENTFLHSWNWGEFNKNTGEKIWRLGVFKDEISPHPNHLPGERELNELVAVVFVIKINARRGSFLFVPQGPIFYQKSRNNNQEILNKLFQYLKNLGKRENVGFVRISPLLDQTQENLKIFQDFGFKNAPIHMMHPEITWLLDITKSEDDLMKDMRKTHRNLIRRAGKDGVEIVQSTDEKYLKAFYNIHAETVKRHKFIPFSYDYIKKEIETFRKDNQIEIFSAIYEGKIISSAIVVFYGKQAFYHHGASSSEYMKVPSSYLSLWEAIKEAKARGKEMFNFYGIVENKPKHPWSGLSKFKKGFGGYQKEILHCQDLPLNINYLLTYFIETARKIKRGY
ncbi:MAG: peptidoglycan bridge formation glycyltransferase FemA/FemB family protein [Candidatus Pacebacteria bacterium]|nr:peptidoglycan bridge formation glycyltransferase FemA/FemB family protein [Candidatus Paceibacterota bacterium]